MESSPFSASTKPNLPQARYVAVDGIPHLISAQAGHRLARLAETFECVWCTGWEDRADEHLPGLLGLPGGWAHLTFAAEPGDGLHWKLEAIEAHAGPDRPVAWIDDAPRRLLRALGRDAARARRCWLPTDPAVGLTDEHVATLLQLGARSVRMTTSGGRSSRTGIPLVPRPDVT